jgi:hypothetical protein
MANVLTAENTSNISEFSIFFYTKLYLNVVIVGDIMGNCNSQSMEEQMCRGCGYGGCPCTAGLDSICGTCNPAWKKSIPGTYDAQYEAWLKANPRPVKPVFDPQPPLNSMDFVCTQCIQCQDFSGITARGTVEIKDPTQVLQCIGRMQDKAEADRAAALAAQARLPPAQPAQPPAQPQQFNATILLLVLFVILAAIIGIVIAYVATSGKSAVTA